MGSMVPSYGPAHVICHDRYVPNETEYHEIESGQSKTAGR